MRKVGVESHLFKFSDLALVYLVTLLKNVITLYMHYTFNNTKNNFKKGLFCFLFVLDTCLPRGYRFLVKTYLSTFFLFHNESIAMYTIMDVLQEVSCPQLFQNPACPPFDACNGFEKKNASFDFLELSLSYEYFVAV